MGPCKRGSGSWKRSGVCAKALNEHKKTRMTKNCRTTVPCCFIGADTLSRSPVIYKSRSGKLSRADDAKTNAFQ